MKSSNFSSTLTEKILFDKKIGKIVSADLKQRAQKLLNEKTLKQIWSEKFVG